MPNADAAVREIAKALRKHVDQSTLNAVVQELLEIPGDKAFRETIQLLARELDVRL